MQHCLGCLHGQGHMRHPRLNLIVLEGQSHMHGSVSGKDGLLTQMLAVLCCASILCVRLPLVRCPDSLVNVCFNDKPDRRRATAYAA